jgi:hypothetical protein
MHILQYKIDAIKIHKKTILKLSRTKKV